MGRSSYEIELFNAIFMLNFSLIYIEFLSSIFIPQLSFMFTFMKSVTYIQFINLFVSFYSWEFDGLIEIYFHNLYLNVRSNVCYENLIIITQKYILNYT